MSFVLICLFIMSQLQIDSIVPDFHVCLIEIHIMLGQIVLSQFVYSAKMQNMRD